MIRDLLHADRVLKLMAMDIPFPEAMALDDDSADRLIEAWAIDWQCCGECGAQADAD